MTQKYSDGLLGRIASIDQEQLDMAILEIEPNNEPEPADPEGFDSEAWLEAEKEALHSEVERLNEVEN